MKRKDFIKQAGLAALSTYFMDLKSFGKTLNDEKPTDRMPMVFIGHGNPMYAISENIYKKAWVDLGKTISKPKAVLCISAHWLTKGTFVHVAEKPKTIHDFGGFPQSLFDVQYPAPGSPEFAKLTKETVKSVEIGEDKDWGLDHGAWSVLKNIYPLADIPVFQMSLDYTKPLQYHFNLAKELQSLRTKGVLIVGSGNIVHNLGMLSMQPNASTFDWAIEFDTFVKNQIDLGDTTPLIALEKKAALTNLAHPTLDHYLPLIYNMGLRDAKDAHSYFNDSFDMGSISMRSVLFK